MSFGPRYAGACIPVLCVGLAVTWKRASIAWRRALLILALASVFIALMVVSTTSQLSMEDSDPLAHSVWPAFWSGQIALNHESMLTVAEAQTSPGPGAFNLGQLIGLHGLPSLIPLFVMWCVAALLWWRMRPEV